jgi:hypothetical protein
MAREARAAEKEAAAIIASLSRASDAAVETTLAGISEKLRNNVPLMYHINALLNNEEWTAVLEASISRVALDNGSDKLESKKQWKLRSGLKKLVHLDRRGHQRLLC